MSTDDPSRRRRFDAEAPPGDLPRRVRVLELRVRVAALEAELERERRRRRDVIEQYERLLDERGRGATRTGDDDRERWDGDIFSLLLD